MAQPTPTPPPPRRPRLHMLEQFERFHCHLDDQHSTELLTIPSVSTAAISSQLGSSQLTASQPAKLSDAIRDIEERLDSSMKELGMQAMKELEEMTASCDGNDEQPHDLLSAQSQTASAHPLVDSPGMVETTVTDEVNKDLTMLTMDKEGIKEKDVLLAKPKPYDGIPPLSKEMIEEGMNSFFPKQVPEIVEGSREYSFALELIPHLVHFHVNERHLPISTFSDRIAGRGLAQLLTDYHQQEANKKWRHDRRRNGACVIPGCSNSHQVPLFCSSCLKSVHCQCAYTWKPTRLQLIVDGFYGMTSHWYCSGKCMDTQRAVVIVRASNNPHLGNPQMPMVARPQSNQDNRLNQVSPVATPVPFHPSSIPTAPTPQVLAAATLQSKSVTSPFANGSPAPTVTPQVVNDADYCKKRPAPSSNVQSSRTALAPLSNGHPSSAAPNVLKKVKVSDYIKLDEVFLSNPHFIAEPESRRIYQRVFLEQIQDFDSEIVSLKEELLLKLQERRIAAEKLKIVAGPAAVPKEPKQAIPFDVDPVTELQRKEAEEEKIANVALRNRIVGSQMERSFEQQLAKKRLKDEQHLLAEKKRLEHLASLSPTSRETCLKAANNRYKYVSQPLFRTHPGHASKYGKYHIFRYVPRGADVKEIHYCFFKDLPKDCLVIFP